MSFAELESYAKKGLQQIPSKQNLPNGSFRVFSARLNYLPGQSASRLFQIELAFFRLLTNKATPTSRANTSPTPAMIIGTVSM